MDEKSQIKHLKSIIHELRVQLTEYENGNGGRNNSMMQVDTDARTSQTISELEAKVRSLEQLLLVNSSNSEHSTNANSESYVMINNLTEALTASQSTNNTLTYTLNETKKDNKRLLNEVTKLQQNISSLQNQLQSMKAEYEEKVANEEYMREIQQNIDEEREKISAERNNLQVDRIRTMTDKTQLEEKVSVL
jgi:chromosome segregation ATPase